MTKRNDLFRKIGNFIYRRRGALAVLLLIVLFSCWLIPQKEGYHMDELLSFELSNAEFTPWIVPTQPEGRLEKFVRNEIYGKNPAQTLSNLAAVVRDVIQNKGNSKLLTYQADVYPEPVWLSADTFHRYLTTDQSDRFDYLSVYFNVKDDNHPPLHFMLLHTVSSIFSGQVAPWMGCIINLFCILGICILLMRIANEILQKPGIGLFASILYAFSLAGMQTLLLIRMYALLTFWCMAVLYLHLKKMQTGEFRRHNRLLIAAIVCGFLTQYFFILYMIFLALCTAVRLLHRKDKKQALFYLRTLVISGIWGLVLFPFAISDVLHSGRGVEAVQNLSSGFSGLAQRLTAFGSILADEVFGGTWGMVLCLLVAVLAIWLGKLWKNGTFLMIALPAVGYFLIVCKAAPYYADRYVMPAFPSAALLLAILLQVVAEKAGHVFSVAARVQDGPHTMGKAVLKVLPAAAVLAALLLPSLLTQKPAYLYQGYRTQEALSETYAGNDCLCVYQGVGYYQNLVEFTHYRNTLLVTQKELLTRSTDSRLAEDDSLVVLLEKGISQEKVSAYLQKQYGFALRKVLLQNGVHQDTIYYYEKAAAAQSAAATGR